MSTEGTTQAIPAADRRVEVRCRGKRARPHSEAYDQRVEQSLRMIEIDLRARRFGAARAAIAALEAVALQPVELDDSTPLADTVLANHPKILSLLERQFAVLYCGELQALDMDRIRATRQIGRESVRILMDFIDQLRHVDLATNPDP